ncbi:MAG: hypothetical protein PHV06_00560 [bacterium]|nr:hypothetical protein [bacterium]
MIYFDVLSGLYQKNIKYLMVGGMSVNLYGIPRVTQDLDIIISTEKEKEFRKKLLTDEI